MFPLKELGVTEILVVTLMGGWQGPLIELYGTAPWLYYPVSVSKGTTMSPQQIN